MMEILHSHFPADMVDQRPLPGIRPVEGDWLRVDEAYGAQMARREALLATRADDILHDPPDAQVPLAELLDEVLARLAARADFTVEGSRVTCPDGRVVDTAAERPLRALTRLVQCDFCLLHREDGEAEHVLRAAVLAFPASWTLAEKAGRPLLRIHKPVAEYPGDVARRVQRLFDGVQPGRPIWRFNRLWYQDAELYQPRREDEKRPSGTDPHDGPFLRSERQTILRLQRSRWVVFAIHSYVWPRDVARAALSPGR